MYVEVMEEYGNDKKRLIRNGVYNFAAAYQSVHIISQIRFIKSAGLPESACPHPLPWSPRMYRSGPSDVHRPPPDPKIEQTVLKAPLQQRLEGSQKSDWWCSRRRVQSLSPETPRGSDRQDG